MEFRIKQYNKGWIVEYKKYYRFGLLFKWIPISTYYVTNRPYYYSSPERARDGALHEIKKLINADFYKIKYK